MSKNKVEVNLRKKKKRKNLIPVALNTPVMNGSLITPIEINII